MTVRRRLDRLDQQAACSRCNGTGIEPQIAPVDMAPVDRLLMELDRIAATSSTTAHIPPPSMPPPGTSIEGQHAPGCISNDR